MPIPTAKNACPRQACRDFSVNASALGLNRNERPASAPGIRRPAMIRMTMITPSTGSRILVRVSTPLATPPLTTSTAKARLMVAKRATSG